jgi:hypothetical protein
MADITERAKDTAAEVKRQTAEVADKIAANVPDDVKEKAGKVVTEAKKRPWTFAAVTAAVLVAWRVLRRKKR